MKLSWAIRMGSSLRPQCKGNYFDTVNGEVGSCTFGAVLEAIGAEHSPYKSHLLRETFPLLAVNNLPSPVLPGVTKYLNISCAIVDLNDNQGWTRERIADWVETIEKQYPELAEASTIVEKVPEKALV